MKTFRVEEIIDVFNKKKYKINTLPYEVNLFGIRNPDNTSNGFNDCVGLFYKDANNKWIIEQYVATTDAGLFYRLNPITPEGTAILVPGQYLDCYKIGLHKGYQALEQCGNMKYVRDNNKDNKLDFLYKIVGYKYIVGNIKSNIHHAGTDSTQVDRWSAACQVIAALKNFLAYLSTVKKSVEAYRHQNLFDYTLLELQDFQ